MLVAVSVDDVTGGPDPAALLDAFGLRGSVVGVEPVAGGWSNRVLRLRTTQGDLLVKQVLNPWGVEAWRDWLAEGWRLEQAAIAAGVPAPEPVVAPDGACVVDVASVDGRATVPVRVHRWVEARTVAREPVDRVLAAWVGGVLATIHRVALRAIEPSPYAGRLGLTTADVWPDLVERATAAGAPFGAALAAAEPVARRASALLVPWADDDALLCHGDLDQKNLLLADSGPLLCDWDVVLPTVPSHDLAHAALALAAWQDPAVAREVLAGYAEAGGRPTALGPTDLGPALAARLGWVRFAVDRALLARSGGGRSDEADAVVVRALDDLPQRVDVAENLTRWLR